ncbi:hypothetical protein ANMWB30_42240 [Arthrobacter sp. MWB30]|jgi:hypothetical protein|nr:hypothetical protein ANMWB30_42240 [Arthrobacter sp. MWB30]
MMSWPPFTTFLKARKGRRTKLRDGTKLTPSTGIIDSIQW